MPKKAKELSAFAISKLKELGRYAVGGADGLHLRVSASINANNVNEQRMARALLQKPQIRVVLHLEVPAKRSRLRSSSIDPLAVQQKLKQLIRSVDPHPVVVDQRSLKHDMDWVVAG